jgi:hypothetical protein
MVLGGLSRIRLIKTDRLANFRAHWLGFGSRCPSDHVDCVFMMIFLALFQFTYRLSAGVTAISAIVFIVFLAGMLALTGYVVTGFALAATLRNRTG